MISLKNEEWEAKEYEIPGTLTLSQSFMLPPFPLDPNMIFLKVARNLHVIGQL